MSSKRRVEPRLGPAGRRLMRRFAAVFDANPVEMELLRMAAFELDEIERMTLVVGQTGLAMKGERGGIATNPLIQEVRTHRAAFASLVAQLRIDEQGSAGVGQVVSDLARHAALKRWHGNRRAS